MIGPPGSSQLEKTLADDVEDRAGAFTCLNCKLQYDSKTDRIPYMLPC